MGHAIIVMYNKNPTSAFIIEGFKCKSVSIDLIESKLLEHFDYLLGRNSVNIKIINKDFLVKHGDKEWLITWSWLTSYVA